MKKIFKEQLECGVDKPTFRMLYPLVNGEYTTVEYPLALELEVTVFPALLLKNLI